VQKDGIRKIRNGKKMLHINILRDPFGQTLAGSAISPTVTKIVQTDKKREISKPKKFKPTKIPLNLEFINANFF
jgi:hypothetical protein